MTGPGFSPPDLEKRLAFNVKVNELLGHSATPAELSNVRLCYGAGWSAEDTVRVLRQLEEGDSSTAAALDELALEAPEEVSGN